MLQRTKKWEKIRTSYQARTNCEELELHESIPIRFVFGHKTFDEARNGFVDLSLFVLTRRKGYAAGVLIWNLWARVIQQC